MLMQMAAQQSLHIVLANAASQFATGLFLKNGPKPVCRHINYLETAPILNGEKTHPLPPTESSVKI
jgi:hypothetical protein